MKLKNSISLIVHVFYVERMIDKILKVHLAKEVLLQSDGASVVDALLFAIPVPIKHLKMSTHEYEHSFPSFIELRNPTLSKLAKKHVLKILGTTSNSETMRRIKDPNLLLYLMGVLDNLSMKTLCSALRSGNYGNKLPGNIIAALELVKLVLS